VRVAETPPKGLNFIQFSPQAHVWPISLSFGQVDSRNELLGIGYIESCDPGKFDRAFLSQAINEIRVSTGDISRSPYGERPRPHREK